VISGIRRDVDEIYGFLDCYAARSFKSLQTFRDNQSVASSGVNKSNENDFLYFFTPEDGPIGCPETSVKIYRYTLSNDPEERTSQNRLTFLSIQLWNLGTFNVKLLT
jgi:hypothetical protein